jgi:glycosyltransferase involved in cell wall biosynthesis
VTKSGGGVLFEPGNPQAYVDALEQLLMDSSRAKQLGAAGRNSVLEKFSADSMARAMADLYSAAAHS